VLEWVFGIEEAEMVRAIYEGGKVLPIDPVPPNWRDGQSLQIEADEEEFSIEQMERDFAELARMCETSDPEDEQRLVEVLRENKEIAKAQVRKQMGLD